MITGAGHDGGEPDAVNVEAFVTFFSRGYMGLVPRAVGVVKVIQPLGYTVEVPDTIAVGVRERIGKYLIPGTLVPLAQGRKGEQRFRGRHLAGENQEQEPRAQDRQNTGKERKAGAYVFHTF
jgi:hypothetical protein